MTSDSALTAWWCAPLGRGLFLQAVALLTIGCLDGPPQYETPSQLPPYILQASVQPPLDTFLVVEENEQLDVTVPFRSDDLGESVEALILLDKQPGEMAEFVLGDTVPAGSFDDEFPRQANINIEVPEELGCHTLTLLLTHESNTSGTRVNDVDLAAWVTWWLDIVEADNARQSSRVADCPTSGEQ